MFGTMRFCVLAALIGLAALAGIASAQPAPTTEHPQAVVELYTSQGCSQCPRANRLIGMFAHERGILALTLPVGIWDYLGWRDTLAEPEFSDRQRAYSDALHVRGRFTPQLIFNGASQISASDWDNARAMLDAARNAPRSDATPDISITRLHDTRVRVALGENWRAAGSDIWLIAYDPGPVEVLVSGGLNVNRVISHYNVVISIQHLDTWDGEAKWYERSHCSPNCAVLVQRPGMGPIIASAWTQVMATH